MILSIYDERFFLRRNFEKNPFFTEITPFQFVIMYLEYYLRFTGSNDEGEQGTGPIRLY